MAGMTLLKFMNVNKMINKETDGRIFMKKKTNTPGLLFAILMTLIIPIVESKSDTTVLTLDQAIDTAVTNSLDMKVARFNVMKAQAQVDEAFGYALPTVSVNASLSHFIEKPKMPFPDFGAMLNNAVYGIMFDENVIPEDNSKFMPMDYTLQSFSLANNYSASVEAYQILFNSTVFEGIGASKIYLQTAKELENATISGTVLSVERAFYGVLLSKDLYDIALASYENAKENYENVSKLYDQGMVSEYDLLQVQVRVENIKPVILQLENVKKNALDGLKLTLGMAPSSEIDVSGSLVYNDEPLPELEEMIKYALENNYSIKTLDLKRQVDKAFISLGTSEYWPTLSAFGNYSFSGASDSFTFQNYKSAMVGINFSMNIFQGNRTKSKVQQYEITYKTTGEQLEKLKDLVKTQIKMKYLELQRVKSLVESQQKNVGLAQRAYEMADIRFREGKSTLLEVKNSDVELRNAKSGLLESIHSYIVSRAELVNLLGRTDKKYFK
jgi:outer membrane protein TolC